MNVLSKLYLLNDFGNFWLLYILAKKGLRSWHFNKYRNEERKVLFSVLKWIGQIEVTIRFLKE